MPVQAPGVRPPDLLHKDSAAVQGIEAFAGRVSSIPLATRIYFTCVDLLRLSQRVLSKHKRANNMPSNP